jgi:hypothetical protein
MKFGRFGVTPLALIILTCGLVTACSTKSENTCDAIVGIATSLSEKADAYWAEEHEKGTGDYAKSEALIVQYDQLVVANPACFTEKEVSFSEGRIASGVNS